ncbi:MAG: hypothetical protein H9901_01685 [Candidatus Paralactobacillus gallistercoris]|uniref:Uncharacterized protein n=1 Tax=Candidatus Paralactobacillus gallistercoris TaxID=2838724 RepID=A0A948TJ36_9LACO|nr:hypothetical protein [Candidatus Paralactobacillus gallistercoris]
MADLTQQLLQTLITQFIADNQYHDQQTVFANAQQLGLLTLQDNRQIALFLTQMATFDPQMAMLLALHYSIPAAPLTLTAMLQMTTDEQKAKVMQYLPVVAGQWQQDMVGYLVEYGKNTIVNGKGLAMEDAIQHQITQLMTLAQDTTLQAQAVLGLQADNETHREQLMLALNAALQGVTTTQQVLQKIFTTYGYLDRPRWQRWQHTVALLQQICTTLQLPDDATITFTEMHKQR